jgi:hypothetical protein
MLLPTKFPKSMSKICFCNSILFRFVPFRFVSFFFSPFRSVLSRFGPFRPVSVRFGVFSDRGFCARKISCKFDTQAQNQAFGAKILTLGENCAEFVATQLAVGTIFKFSAYLIRSQTSGLQLAQELTDFDCDFVLRFALPHCVIKG